MSVSRQPNFSSLLGLAWLLVVVQLVAQNWADTALTLLDTDDAMRLAQMRDWLAGQAGTTRISPASSRPPVTIRTGRG